MCRRKYDRHRTTSSNIRRTYSALLHLNTVTAIRRHSVITSRNESRRSQQIYHLYTTLFIFLTAINIKYKHRFVCVCMYTQQLIVVHAKSSFYIICGHIFITGLQVEASVGRRPDRDWVRSSGRPRNRWIDQLRQDHQRPPADIWRAAIRRGHTGATLRSSTTTR